LKKRRMMTTWQLVASYDGRKPTGTGVAVVRVFYPLKDCP
jgi:hypothetical protein